MRTVADLSELERGAPTVLTIGAFDGVHRGHQFLMRRVIDRARHMDYTSTILTFDPRPQVVLRPGSLQLTGGQEKTRIIAALGPDVLGVIPFTRDFSQIPAQRFLLSILEHVNLAEIWIGADFAFGHNREGNVDFLIHSGQHTGFAVHVLPREKLDGVPISSTVVRDLVTEGDVAKAAWFLGHYLTVPGCVVTGAGRGSDLGFPTANLEPPSSQLLPATGIYAGYVRLDGKELPAAISVGYNLVFGGDAIVVEAYVLDFEGDLRGKGIALDFVHRIREEQNFDSVDGLVAQMHGDVEQVRNILSTAREPGELILLP